MSKVKTKENALFLISCIVAWTLLLIAGLSSSLSGENAIYAIGQIQAYDSSIFQNNVYMGTGVISPRYIVDALFGLMMHINGGNWAGAALVWIYFGVAIQAVAVANISRRINEEHQVILSAVFTCLLILCDNYLAGFHLISLRSASMGAALAFSTLSISFLVGEKRNYNFAWCFAACSIICHIHEGIYCCAVIFMIALIDCIFQKKILFRENLAMVAAIGALMAVVVPSFLTDTMDITEAEFVSIYSVFRHPHHLVPGTWGIDSIIKAIGVDIALFAFAIETTALTKEDGLKKKTVEAGTLVFAWIAALAIMYVFTEIIPLSLVSTMFLSKAFKYVLLVALIWLVEAFVDLRKKGFIVSGYLTLLFGFLATSFELIWVPVLFLCISAVLYAEKAYLDRKGMPLLGKSVWAMDVLFFLFIVLLKRKSLGIVNVICVILIFFAIAAISFALKRQFKGYRGLAILACACLIMLSLANKVIRYSDGRISWISGEAVLKLSMTSDLYELAEKFKDSTSKDAEFIGDPDIEERTGWFQIVSERNCYVVYKVIPSSKGNVDEWYTRYLATKGFLDRSAEDVKSIMELSGVDYVLIDADHFDKFDESESFSVYTTSTEDSYRIYKLTD